MHSTQSPILDAWKFFMKDIPSPDSYIEMSFYGMIAAALQRRVYLGSETWPLFPNLFIILVGFPATGKSLAINPTKKLLETFKQNKFKFKKEELTTQQEQLQAVEALTREYMNESGNKKLHGFEALTKKEPLVIPIAPNATTYEALVKSHSESLRTIVPKNPKAFCKDGLYTHSSLYVVNDEISSLFRKHTDDLVNYLVKAYDCEDYEYEAKQASSHYVKSSCLNVLGGTQPNFLKRVFAEQLLTEGFASRTIFVYEEAPRFPILDLPIPTPEQLEARRIVEVHVEKLTKLFGQVTISPEAHEFMKHRVLNVWSKSRINNSEKLNDYYGRKTLHYKKLILASHFGESESMEVGLYPVQHVADLLDRLEEKMDKALNSGGRNQLTSVYDKVHKYIKSVGGDTRINIWVKFIDDFAHEQEVEDVLNFLVSSKKITYVDSERKYK